MIRKRGVGDMVQLAVGGIGLDPSVPLRSIELGEPLKLAARGINVPVQELSQLKHLNSLPSRD